MNYKLKAKIQNLVNVLPTSLSYPLYYWMRRHFGGLRKENLNPMSRLKARIETCKRIEKIGRSFVGATFLEVGTGRRLNTPLAFWLLGAERVITVDLNPYLKEELVKNDLDYIQKNKIQIQEWDKIAGNRYMYMNRLRHDDFINLFQDLNCKILINEPDMDKNLIFRN